MDGLCRALYAKGEVEEALAQCDNVLGQFPNLAEAHVNRGFALLLQGDFDRGWAEYDWRLRCVEWAAAVPTLPIPLWEGGLLRGKTILLRAEQGLGDTLQFIRLRRWSSNEAATCFLSVPSPCNECWRTAPASIGLSSWVIARRAWTSTRTCRVPGLLGTVPATIPAKIPYLKADPALKAVWKEKLARHRGLKIGIAWQGNPAFPGDRQRSFRLERFAPLARLDGVELFSLQKGFGSEQVEQNAKQFTVQNLGPGLEPRGYSGRN